AGCLIYVGSETYETTSAFPFVRHKPVPKPPTPPAQQPPAPDLANVAYAAAVPVTKRTVRPAPLVCDTKGNVYAVLAETGRTIRISSVIRHPPSVTTGRSTPNPARSLSVEEHHGAR